MRRVIIASAVALLGFGGQAVAAEGFDGFSLPFCGAPPAHGGKAADVAFLNSCTIGSLVFVAAAITAIAVAVDNNDHSKSA